MALPKITYDAGAGTVTVTFKRGPFKFLAAYAARFHDNLATDGGTRERVLEAADIVITFTMPALTAGDDLGTWNSFMTYAIGGGAFRFYPQATGGTYYNCIDVNGTLEFTRVARGVMAAPFKFQILNDGQKPANPGAVMEAFYA